MPAAPTPTTRLARRFARLATATIVAVAAVLLAAPIAAAAPANYKGVSADGKVVFFETDEQLVSGDTDTKRDVYERSFDADVGAFVTREVSLGPTGGTDAYPALFQSASANGNWVFFSTEEAMVEGDSDRRTDVYLRDLETGETTLVSLGGASCAPGCGNGAFEASFARASVTGAKVFFVTAEKLIADDTDARRDIYVRDIGTGAIERISAGSSACAPGCGNGGADADLRAISGDGSVSFFTTTEALVAADLDTTSDVYAHAPGPGTTLVSRGECSPSCGSSGAIPVFQTNTDDGSRAFFTTSEQLVAADEDTATDVYARDIPAGPTILISGGSSSLLTASFEASSGDGAHVFFTTAESLLGADGDGTNDIYEWSGGALDLITPGACLGSCGVTFDAISADAGTVVFSTAEQLAGEDSDGNVDVYEQGPVGGPVLASRGSGCGGCGNGAADARFNRASADASHVIFTSVESLSAEDGDSEDDIYARDVDSGETSLITTSPSYCPLPKGSCGATFVDASGDGLHVFFTTIERFTLDDGDNEVDVYERFLGETPGAEATRLVSTGNSPDLELGPPPPALSGTDPPSPAAATKPAILGLSEPGAIKLYATSNCSGEPVATGTADQLADPGLPVTVAAGSETSFRATAEAEGFVSDCSSPIDYVQQSDFEAGEDDEGGEGGGGLVDKKPTTGSAGGAAVGGQKSVFAYVTPHTRITFAPAAKTRSRNPVFRFTDETGQPGTNFTCKLDRKAWKPCGSPHRLQRLSRGRHVLAVRAINAVGDAEPTPAKRAFKLVPR